MRAPTLCAPLALAALALASAGCGRHYDVKTPPGFVELETDLSDYDYRASSAGGVVTALRVVDTGDKGDIGFWTNVVNLRMREELGYAPAAETDLGAGGGPKGRLLRFTHEQGGKVYCYDVALFVAGGRLYLLESGGRKDLFDRQADALAWQRRAFSPK